MQTALAGHDESHYQGHFSRAKRGVSKDATRTKNNLSWFRYAADTFLLHAFRKACALVSLRKRVQPVVA
jgi:hypothetical protein